MHGEKSIKAGQGVLLTVFLQLLLVAETATSMGTFVKHLAPCLPSF